MRIIKIGGSVLANLQNLDYLASNFAHSLPENVVFVISAFKNYTDELVRMNNYFSPENSSFLITAGEQITAGLFAMALEKYGRRAMPLTAWQIDLKKNDNNKLSMNTAKIKDLLGRNIIPVVMGFQCLNEENEISDLGRGGSDLTAVLLAGCLKGECFLIKEAGGIRAADPELIANSFIWSTVHYDNIEKLAQAGCKVVQYEALKLAKDHKIALKIADISLFARTSIGDVANDFWSLIKYKQKLRMVADGDFLKYNFGYPYNYGDVFCEFEGMQGDLTPHANSIYQVVADKFR